MRGLIAWDNSLRMDFGEIDEQKIRRRRRADLRKFRLSPATP